MEASHFGLASPLPGMWCLRARGVLVSVVAVPDGWEACHRTHAASR